MLNHQRGMQIIELMVAVAMALVISGALGTLFVTTTKAKQEINRTGEQVENGRIAMDLLLQDVAMAGYWDGLEYTVFTNPSMPGLCDVNIPSLQAAVPVYLQGVDNVSVSTLPSCLSDVKSGTDIVVVRRAGTCNVSVAGCDAVPPYFQASRCSPPYVSSTGVMGSITTGELSSPTVTNWYAVDLTNSATSMPLHKMDCGSGTGGTPFADVRRYLVRIYYIANNDVAGDNMPSLKMAELRNSAWSVSTVASGIEQLQVEYAGAASYATAPATVADWRAVSSVKVYLVARNSSPSPQFTDTKVYAMGMKADGVTREDFGPTEYGPADIHIRRHLFTGAVSISNPVGLRGG